MVMANAVKASHPGPLLRPAHRLGNGRKRKRMGIEPTRRPFGHLTSFEDWGGHQTNKRFRASFLIRKSRSLSTA